MEMIAVDPKLFITCRLCLDEMGMYQIVPKVQEQIKYCFDIDVDPFDRLPQLICKKCQGILSEYYLVKTNFILKQNALKTKLELPTESQDPIDTEVTRNSPQQETVSSSQQNENDNEITPPVLSDRVTKSRSRSLSSSTTSDVLFVKTSIAQRPKFTSRYQNQSWHKYYFRRYGCRLCSKTCASRGSMTNHLKSHNRLKERHQNILKNFCNVALEKIDRKPNLTNLFNTVVLTKDKIYTDGDKLDFFTYYISKETTDKVHEPERATRRLHSFSNYDSSDDDENFVIKRSSKKRRRLMSDSSKETVVLEGDNNKNSVSSGNESESNTTESNVIDCINIDDSSDTESITSNNERNGEDSKNIACAIPRVKDDKTLQSIITKCYNKYMQKKKSARRPENFDSLLKTKMLSMGIKVLHPQNAINCTGLLRYTEYKKLNIKWAPTNKVGFGRIMPKLKPGDDSINDNLRWKDLPGGSISKPFKINVNPQNDTVLKPTTSNENANKLPYLVVLPVNDQCINSVVSSSEHDNLKDQNPLHKLDESNKQNKSSHQLEGHLKELKAPSKQEGHSKENQPVPKPGGSAVLYSYSSNTDSDMKLLNANPVANPKQLPKKTNLSEVKQNIKPTTDAVVVPSAQEPVPIYLDDEDNHTVRTEALCMPIITSTTSLAVDTIKHDEKGSNDKCNSDNTILNQSVSKELEKSAPRIKVKPASELMSQEAFNNLSSQSQQPAATSRWNLTQNATDSFESQNMPNNANINTVPVIAYAPTPSEKPRECVILDTVEFPNTKTDSPINYFKDLLLIHSIVLLDSTEKSTKKFFRLIKFKLLLNEDSMARPVVLCLALQCAENEFCLEVRGLYQENINLQELSANWQWEIIKVFKGNVEDNLLKNAQKVSQTVYEYTKSFLCLLKSINFKTVT